MPSSTRVERRGLRAALTIASALLVAGVGVVEAVEIWEIQGSGMRSPLEGSLVETTDNTVTAVADRYFVIQTPEERADGDPRTSDGIFVRWSDSDNIDVGDRVTVQGEIVEFYGQTEFGSVSFVHVLSNDHPLPAPVVLDGRTPSANQPWPETELERFEGMRVRVENGVVSGPTDRYGDVVITSSGARLFREPGIEYPGLPGLPVWDGNPEGFEMDPDAVYAFDPNLAAGTWFRAEGVLGFVFGSYQLWPTELDLVDVPVFTASSPIGGDDAWTVGSQNCARLARSGGDVPYQDRLQKLSRHFREAMGAPDIVAVQEVASLGELEDLADRIGADDPSLVYDAVLVEGNDPSGIDVGFLVSEEVAVSAVEQIGADVRFTWDQSLLFDRPPLVLETTVAAVDLSVVVVHLKSLGGIDDPGSSGERVRRKRFEQSVWLSEWAQEHQTVRPDDALLLIGDFNAFEFSDGSVDVLGQVTGRPDPAGALLAVDTNVDPPLDNLVLDVEPEDRYSFIYRGSAEVLDHAVVDETLLPLVRSVFYTRGNADSPLVDETDPGSALRSSDHDGLVVTLGPPVRSSGGRRAP